MKLNDVLVDFTLEQISQIPKKICEIMIVNVTEYSGISDKVLKNELDNALLNFKKSKDYIGFYKKDDNHIYVKSSWLSKTVCERRICDFLKGLR